ncbi:MAG: carboxymuconolactone decarboxylase family protein [Tepidiformaceae bacterium]
MRLQPATREAFPENLVYVYDRMAGGAQPGGAPGKLMNIFAALGNNPELLRAYLRLGNGLWASCGLDVPTRELAILRAAVLAHSAYEWHQHVRIGREAGLSDERILALHQWKPSGLFNDLERAVLAYADALAAGDHPPQDVHDELAKQLPPAAVVGVNLLVGFYAMTARFLAAMEVEPEENFVGWQLEG